MRIPIYSRDMTRIGTIRHASKVGYKRMFNDLHTASFEIPADDDADNDLCETVHGIVDIVDGDKSVGKYRISLNRISRAKESSFNMSWNM